MIKRAVTYLVAILTLTACFESEEYNTTLVVIPAYQPLSGDEFERLDGAVVYAFAADTTDYTPASYEQALAGVVTNKTTGETLSPIATGEFYAEYYSYIYEIEEDDDDEDIVYPYEDGEVVSTLIEGLSMQIKRQDIMLVAIDTKNEAYAYSNYELGMNLPTTYITVSFRPWKTEPFSQGTWYYIVPEVITENTETE